MSNHISQVLMNKNITLLVIDLNLSRARISNYPPNFTFPSEFQYINSLDADILLIRESNREVELDCENRSFDWIFKKFLPDYDFKGVSIKGDGSSNAFGISILAKHSLSSYITFEDIDITAIPETEEEKSSWNIFMKNRIPIVYYKNIPLAAALHLFLNRDGENSSVAWIWKKEIENVKIIIKKIFADTGRLIDIFADANMVQPDQKYIWKELAKEFNYKYSFGTNSDLHLSFCGQPWDFVPKEYLTDNVFGFMKEMKIIFSDGIEKECAIPRSMLDGAVSMKPFNIIYPNILNGILHPTICNIQTYDGDSKNKGLEAFINMQNANAEQLKKSLNPIAGFDHVAFMIEYDL